jgi:hypothetical protein
MNLSKCVLFRNLYDGETRNPKSTKCNSVRNLEQTVTATLALFKIALHFNRKKKNVDDRSTPTNTLHPTCFNTTAISSGFVSEFAVSVIPSDYNK